MAAPRCERALGLVSGGLPSSQPLHKFPTRKLWREVELQMPLGDGAHSRVRVRTTGRGSQSLVLPAPQGLATHELGLPSASHRELFVPTVSLRSCKLKLIYQN